MKQEKISFSRKNLITYLALTLVFILISYLSILYIFNHLSNHTALISLNLLNLHVWVQLFILLILFYLLDTLRLFYILKTLNMHVGFLYMIKLTFINIFISNITPFATGGGFAQIYFLNRKGIPLGGATAASSMRTLLPILFFFITTPVILLFNQRFLTLFSGQHKIYIYLLVILYICLMVVFYKLIKNPAILKYIFSNIINLLNRIHLIKNNKLPIIQKKISVEIDSFSKNISYFFLGKKLNIIISLTLTILYLLVLFLFPVLLLNGLHYKISPFTVIAIQIVITFMTYFAPTPGATGVAEGGFSLIFSSFVLKKDLVFLTFSWRFFTMYLGVLIGLFVFYYEVFFGKRQKRDVIENE